MFLMVTNVDTNRIFVRLSSQWEDVFGVIFQTQTSYPFHTSKMVYCVNKTC